MNPKTDEHPPVFFITTARDPDLSRHSVHTLENISSGLIKRWEVLRVGTPPLAVWVSVAQYHIIISSLYRHSFQHLLLQLQLNIHFDQFIEGNVQFVFNMALRRNWYDDDNNLITANIKLALNSKNT